MLPTIVSPDKLTGRLLHPVLSQALRLIALSDYVKLLAEPFQLIQILGFVNTEKLILYFDNLPLICYFIKILYII